MQKFLIYIIALQLTSLHGQEMVFGQEEVLPGISIIFEAAPKDSIFPDKFFLQESETDIHIEMLINWSENGPKGSQQGGFIPYLVVSATIKNKNGNELKTMLTPHLNLSDNFHYARNIKLPGNIDDLYDVEIKINPPKKGQLGIHKDWKQKYGSLMEEKTFNYSNLSFRKIALQSRN